MTDTPKKEEETEQTAPAKSDTADLSTTTANDGSLAINQVEPAASSSDKKEVANDSKSEASTDAPAAPATEDTLIQTPVAASSTAPVIVSDADVAAVEKENDPHQSLAEQIEVLTGEVQALEAKIEKLTGGVTEPTPQTAPEPITAPVAETPLQKSKAPTAPVEEKETSSDSVPPAVDSTSASVPVTPPSTVPESNVSAPVAATPVNDIYTKVLAGQTGAPSSPSSHKDLNDDTTIMEGTSGIGTIGEVLIVFGLISLLILGASPFLKSTIGGNWEALKSIGWPTVTLSLTLGFILFLFNKGRIVFKIFTLLLALIAAVMTAAVFDYGSMLGPISNLVDPIASFYK